MNSSERFLTALRHGVPDRVPVTPDFSNYIPCKRTGLPFWDIYFFGQVPLWQAYLDAAHYYGIDAWVASAAGAPLVYEPAPIDVQRHFDYRPDDQAMTCRTTTRTPDGTLTEAATCYRADPPSPTEKPIKDLARDFRAFQCTQPMPVAIDRPVWEAIQDACRQRDFAFGVCIGYPGLHAWSSYTEGGVAPLAYAAADAPQLLDAWFDWDLARGTRAMELIVAAKPDYILFGGSGTITLASPALARRYAIPALQRWSAMAKAAGIPTMLHSCGKSRILVDLLCDETDVDCINPLEIAPMGDVDLAEVKAARGQRMGLMGNLHTTEVMLRGSPERVRNEARTALLAGAPGGGFILSTGDQCPRDTPEENLFALVEASHRWGVYDPATGTLAASSQPAL